MSIYKSFAVTSLTALALFHPSTAHVLSKRQASPVIYSCSGGRVALTFDDGPAQYTGSVLDKLAASGHKATFFVNGQNYGNIYDNAPVVRRMISEGHQVGSHTWAHADLAAISSDEVVSQLTQVEKALLDIIGKFSIYLRPPYLSTNANVLSIVGGLGYKVIDIDLDTLDSRPENQSPQAIQNSVQNFENGINQGKTLVLAHDPLVNTATILVDRMIQILDARGIKSIPIGQCIDDPPENWYRTSRDGGPGPGPGPTDPPPGGVISPDGTCGPEKGYRCLPGLCCSKWGWCDVGPDFCADGCQPAYGVCGI